MGYLKITTVMSLIALMLGAFYLSLKDAQPTAGQYAYYPELRHDRDVRPWRSGIAKSDRHRHPRNTHGWERHGLVEHHRPCQPALTGTSAIDTLPSGDKHCPPESHGHREHHPRQEQNSRPEPATESDFIANRVATGADVASSAAGAPLSREDGARGGSHHGVMAMQQVARHGTPATHILETPPSGQHAGHASHGHFPSSTASITPTVSHEVDTPHSGTTEQVTATISSHSGSVAAMQHGNSSGEVTVSHDHVAQVADHQAAVASTLVDNGAGTPVNNMGGESASEPLVAAGHHNESRPEPSASIPDDLTLANPRESAHQEVAHDLALSSSGIVEAVATSVAILGRENEGSVDGVHAGVGPGMGQHTESEESERLPGSVNAALWTGHYAATQDMGSIDSVSLAADSSLAFSAEAPRMTAARQTADSLLSVVRLLDTQTSGLKATSGADSAPTATLTLAPPATTALQGAPFELPLVVNGQVSLATAERFPSGDLVLDLSAIADWGLSITGSACQLEADATRLRCAGVAMAHFVGEEVQHLVLGTLQMHPKRATTVTLPMSWENGIEVAVQEYEQPAITVLPSARTYAVASPSQGYELAALKGNWSYPLGLVASGEGEPTQVTLAGRWTDETLVLTGIDVGSSGWQCDAQAASFSCTLANGPAPDTLPTIQLRFAKPATLGKRTLQLTVQSDYGALVRTSQQTRTLAFGLGTTALQQALQAAEQRGAGEFVLPEGLYVGTLYNDRAHPLTLRGETGSELWISGLGKGKKVGLEAAGVEQLTLYVGQAVRLSRSLAHSRVVLGGALLDLPLLEANRIQLEGPTASAFSCRSDMRLHNNLILAEPVSQQGTGSGALFVMADVSPRPQIQLVNNTLVGISQLAATAAMASWQLTNNLLVTDSSSPLPLFDVTASVESSHNLLPSAYQSLAGTNLYTDTPGVDAANGYGLNADSPALDAGDSAADSGLTDLYGNGRIVGKAMDIGAVERQ